jgi:hypothetical protein
MVAQHEYAHTIVNQVFRHLPLTLNEGFAEYLSTFRADDQLAEFGHPISWHRAAIQTMRLRSLDEMFSFDVASLNQLQGDDQALFYAESWAFVHYLLRADVTGGRFTQFMRAAADGTPIRSAFERFLLPTSRGTRSRRTQGLRRQRRVHRPPDPGSSTSSGLPVRCEPRAARKSCPRSASGGSTIPGWTPSPRAGWLNASPRVLTTAWRGSRRAVRVGESNDAALASSDARATRTRRRARSRSPARACL